MRFQILLPIVVMGFVPVVEAEWKNKWWPKKKKIEVCQFPRKRPTNFRTKSIKKNAFSRRQKRKEVLEGSCEDNCLDICFDEDSPIFPDIFDPEATNDCVDRCLPDDSDAVALFLSGSDQEEYIVEACDQDSVLLVGPHASTVLYPGMFLIYEDEDAEGDSCGINCSPLFRRIEAVVDNGQGYDGLTSVFLTTSFATFGEILGPGVVAPLWRTQRWSLYPNVTILQAKFEKENCPCNENSKPSQLNVRGQMIG